MLSKMLKVGIVSLGGEIPSYETEGASAFDLRAYLSEKVIINPMERSLIPTGVAMEIPKGYEGQIRARSGLAIKKGIGLVNGIGTIDSDYRGEIKVILINFGTEPFEIENGDRIAQMVICSYEKVTFKLQEELSNTKRGEGGFGHTGV